MNKGIVAYLNAVELEADSEAIYHKSFGVTGAATRIPRVLILLGFINRHSLVLNGLLPLMSWCYALLVAPAFFLYRAGQIAIKQRVKHCIDIKQIYGKEVYLATSSGSNLAYLPQDTAKPDFILTTPFRGGINNDVLPSATRINILSCINLTHLAGAWWQAVLTNVYLLKKKYTRKILWGYTAMEWFLVYRVLLQLRPNAVWVSNHHDRWLMLSLSIPGVPVKLVQHGRLYHTLPNGEHLSYKKNLKISGLSKIYVLDECSERLFNDYIDCRSVEFLRITPSLLIKPWRANELASIKILIIGGSNKLNFYLDLMDLLTLEIAKTIDLAIRHHPLQKNRLSELRSPINYWELSSDEAIPSPDLIISYGSSIDDQLKSATHAPIITYAWSDYINLTDIVNQVKVATNNLPRN